MSYIPNPKTKGSGIITAIPQTGTCPNKCAECFFQSGKSYLEPLEDNLPNMPGLADIPGITVVRVNDGNDSNVQRSLVMEATKIYPFKFYNTAIPKDLEKFDAPVVLTINPGVMTDHGVYVLDDIPKNLMFVRIRTNTWNLKEVDEGVEWYTSRGVPVVLTFMAYEKAESVPLEERFFVLGDGDSTNYIERKRTLNTYWAISTDAWREVMKRYQDNILVYSCGKIEGEKGATSCKFCGNCLREYHSTMVRLRGGD